MQLRVKKVSLKGADIAPFFQSCYGSVTGRMRRMEHVIEIQNLTKHYGKSRGVEDVSFSVREGEIMGFLGPNGAGKSTTIRSMLGFLRYEKGNIEILGKDAKKQQEQILREVGYMPSEAMFYPSMKVKDVIKFAADARKMNCDKEAEYLCKKLEVNIDKRISELSLGNRKKVSIVCAMQHKPKLFIFDEPTSGLDPLMQEVFFDLILEYNKQGATCFLSSHVLSEVKRYCKNATIIREGKIIATDSVENLSHSDVRHIKLWRNGKLEEFVHQGDINELLQQLQGTKIDDLLIEQPSLDEVFMHYYEQ